MPHRPFVKTLRAQWLGERLRELREQRGLSRKLVAEHLDRDQSALGRYERAEWPIPRSDVVRLLDLYGFHVAADRDRLLRLAEDVWRLHRWVDNPGDSADDSFIDLPWLAARAERVCLFHPTAVPDLLQTPRYASLASRYATPNRERPHPHLVPTTAVQAVVDEAALRRPVGGADTMRAQLRHLLQLHQDGRADIRVLPTDIALHPGLDGPFWLFHLPAPYPPVGYQNVLSGQLFVELPQVERFVDTYQRLTEAALSAEESAELLTKLSAPTP